MAEMLSYADLPARRGIIYERRPGGLTITVPSSRSNRIATVLWGLLSGGAPLPAYHRIRSAFRPIIIEVSATSVSILNVESDGDVQDFIRPREAVYEVKYVSHSGNLVIKARGHDMIDCRPFKDRQLLEWVAAEVREALGLERKHSCSA